MEELLKKAAIIRDETDDGENTAERVGSLLLEIIGKIGQIVPSESIDGDSLTFSADTTSLKLKFTALDGNGERVPKEVSIPLVTVQKAGVMSAQMLSDLKESVSSALKAITNESNARTKADESLQKAITDGDKVAQTAITKVTQSKGEKNGIAPLDENAKLPATHIPFGENEETVFDGKRGKQLESKTTVLRYVSYSDLDTSFSSGFYIVNDSDALLSDIMLVSSWGEGGMTVQLLISSSANSAKGVGIRFRLHDGETWSEWNKISETYDDAVVNGYKGTKDEFYHNLSSIDIIRFLKTIAYSDINTAVSSGYYIVTDGETYSSDILLVSRYGEDDAVAQVFFSFRFTDGVLKRRILTGNKWSDWEEISGTGSGGTGSGFYNVTQLHPLETGFYTKETAVPVLADAEINNEQKPGMIITIETSAGKWEDYRFEGTNVESFFEPTAWQRFGGGDAIKNVTVTKGTNTEELSPDERGNVNIEIPVTETDETITENGTNPVEGKAIFAKFAEIGSKYPVQLKLNTIGEGDNKAYSMSLVNEDGEILDTSDQFTGGGGGSVATTKIVLTRITPNPTVKNGDTVKLFYSYDHIDTTSDSTTGNAAKAVITITRGATSSTIESTIAAGSIQTVDVTKYLGIGSNSVKVRVTVGEGDEMQVSSLAWTVNVVQLTLTSSFNIASVINRGDTINIPYALSGSGTKTLRCFVNGENVDSRVISASTANGSFAVNTSAMVHGSHSVQMVAELELTGGNKILTNSIYFDIAVREQGKMTPVIATRFDYKDGTIIEKDAYPFIPVTQYDNYTLTYAAFDPTATPTRVDIYESNTLISSSNVSFVVSKFVQRAMGYGASICQIICGNAVYNLSLVIAKSELELSEPTDNLLLRLSAQGRSNSDTNRDQWTYKEITTEFSGFKWGGDGWMNNALRHTDNARSIVKFMPLQQPEQNANNAFAFMVKFKVSEVTNEEAEVIRCVDETGTGFVITAQEVRMTTKGNSTVSQKLASGETYEIGFVSFPKAGDGASEYEKENTEMLYLYIDGSMSGSVQRGTSDSVYQETPQYIVMGDNGATLDVYQLRAYNTYLTDSQIVDCFTIDQESVDDLLAKYEANNILDENGNVTVDSVPDDMRYVIITGKEANGVPTVLQAAITNNKKTKFDVDEILSIKRSCPELNFRLVGGCIVLQGTSSLAYPTKNDRIYMYNSRKEDGLLYLCCDAQGVGGILQIKAVYSFRLPSGKQKKASPVNCFCLKADYAESSGSHNTGMAKLVHNILMEIGDLTPAQRYVDEEYEYDVRTTIDGEPCLLFYRGTVDETPIFLGKFNFNNDKSTEAVFGFLDIPGYHDQPWVQEKFGGKNPTECWEFLNNDYAMGMFLDDDFDKKNDKGTPAWLDVFEARFPDDDELNSQYEDGTLKPKYLEALVKWVKSTQYDGAKFKNELADYFDVDYLCDYYMFTDIFGCVDQRVKNMMMAFWYDPDKDKVLAYLIFYDNDTILGVRNDGRLKYSFDVDENTTDPELSTDGKTVYAYAGHDSVLWKNLREQFPDRLAAAYKRLRAKMSNDVIFNMFDEEQSNKFCERIYNLDAINKYVKPKTQGVEVNQDGVISNVKYSYLEAMQGSRRAHRHWWVTNRMNLFDARYSAGQYTATDISFKGNSAAGATIKAVPSRDFYFEFRREGDTMVHSKVNKDQEWSYTYNQVANVGTIFHLLGGVFMKKLDLSGWGGFTDVSLPRLPVLENLVMGAIGSTYTLTELAIGDKLPMLRTLEIRNYTKLPSLDLSHCTRIEEVVAAGCTSMSTIVFAEGAPLVKLRLPANFQTLTLRSLPNLTRNNIVFDNIRSITGLWVENCAKLDGFALFEELYKLSPRVLKYVRITGLALKGDGTNLKSWYNSGLGGIDSYGNTVNGKCKLCGSYELTRFLEDTSYENYNARFDELNIKIVIDAYIYEIDKFNGEDYGGESYYDEVSLDNIDEILHYYNGETYEEYLERYAEENMDINDLINK